MSPKFPADRNGFPTQPIPCPLQSCLRLKARHFPPGTQDIPRRLCRALPAGTAPGPVAAGRPLSPPQAPCDQRPWRCPFPSQQAILFPPPRPRWMPLMLSSRVPCVTWLSPRPAEPHVTPVPAPTPPGVPPPMRTQGCPCVGALRSRGGTAHVGARPGIKASLPP